MATKAVETAATEVTKGIVSKVGLPIVVAVLGLWFIWTNWDTIDSASRKLEAVDGNTERSKGNQQGINKIELRLIDIDDFIRDTSGELTRKSQRIDENTNWRNAQEKRAIDRIANQGFREKRVTALEKENAEQDAEIQDLRERILTLETLIKAQ